MNLDNYNENITILQIELTNFMCHDHIIIDFKKPFTCIGGRNGSGKSAIMIAIGILFGQRSNNLERGNSFKGLIKSGERFFVIKCILNNNRKFYYDFFGDFIILEKKVTFNSSSFVIKNKNRKVYSYKIEDLEFLLDFFNIRFENPLNFLTQEHSKKFLSSSDCYHLYQLFLKGSEIADIKCMNAKYEKNVLLLKEKIDNIESKLNEVNDKFSRESKRMEIVANIDNLNLMVKELEKELKWTGVYEHKTQSNLLKIEIANTNALIENEQKNHANILEETEVVKNQINMIMESTQTLKNENKIKLTKVDESISLVAKKIRNMENEFKDLKQSYLIKKDLIKRLDKSNVVTDDRNVLHDKQLEIENCLENAKVQQNKLQVVFENEKKKKEDLEDKMSKYKKNIYFLQKKVDFYDKLKENNDIHPEMKQIVQLIQNHKFKDRILGPMADYVTLKDPKWFKVASIVLQKLLTSFICFNNEDRDKLSQIFKNKNVQFSILIPSNNGEKLIQFEKNNDFKLLYDVIECKSTVILNQLILMANIEEKALVEDRNEAYRLIRSNPKNIDCIYTVNGDTIKKIGGSVVDFAPRKLERYFFEKSHDKQKNVQLELNKLMHEKPSKANLFEYTKALDEYENISKKVNKYERDLAEILRQIESAEEVWNTQKNFLTAEDIHESYKLLEKQMVFLDNKICKYKEDYKNLEVDKLNIKNIEYPSVMENEIQLQKLQVQANIISDNIQKLVQKKCSINVKLNDKIRDFDASRFNLLKTLPEVIDPRPAKTICDEISRINIDIEESMKVGSKENIQAKLNEIIERRNFLDSVYTHNKQKIDDIYESFCQRVKKRDELINNISKGASNKFEDLTRKKGYKGQLLFDHTNESLQIKMEVHDHGIAGSKETLSGGERSFAAMSLLFSLWPYTHCPVKILDEFDVFMDDLNRKYIIQKFLDYFKESKNQVILITPLSTKDLEDEDIDILVLSSPRDFA